jgi:hypothetical protein
MMSGAIAIRIFAYCLCVSIALLSSSSSSGAQIPTAYAAVTDFEAGQMYLSSVTREAFQRLQDALVFAMLEMSPLSIVGNRRNMKIATNSIQENRARVFRNPNEL